MCRKQVRCSQTGSLLCEDICGALLNCSEHFCAQVCHSGTCQPCRLRVQQGKESLCHLINGFQNVCSHLIVCILILLPCLCTLSLLLWCGIQGGGVWNWSWKVWWIRIFLLLQALWKVCTNKSSLRLSMYDITHFTSSLCRPVYHSSLVLNNKTCVLDIFICVFFFGLWPFKFGIYRHLYVYFACSFNNCVWALISQSVALGC